MQERTLEFWNDIVLDRDIVNLANAGRADEIVQTQVVGLLSLDIE